MDSTMIEVLIKWDVLVWRDLDGLYEFSPSAQEPIRDLAVWQWLRSDLMNHMELTEEEERDMGHSQYVERTMTFEVEVEHNGSKALGATCHTVCPNFVKGWIEKEAMKQYEKEALCTSSS